MLLAWAGYVSTAHASTQRRDLDLLYHDGRAHTFIERLFTWLSPSPRRGAHSSGPSASANVRTGHGALRGE